MVVSATVCELLNAEARNADPNSFTKQERKTTSACRILYTIAIIIIKFKNTKNDIPNTTR